MKTFFADYVHSFFQSLESFLRRQRIHEQVIGCILKKDNSLYWTWSGAKNIWNKTNFWRIEKKGNENCEKSITMEQI